MLDTVKTKEVLTYLCEELGGDWFLTGGTLVRLQFDASRGTDDIDFVQISHPALNPTQCKNQLYQWLIQNGLGPEWVNDAVEPFLRSVPDWQSETREMQSGSKGRIFRPTLTLFIYLKLKRGTEIDLEDIRSAIPHCPEGLDEKKFRKWADKNTIQKFEKLKTSGAFNT